MFNQSPLRCHLNHVLTLDHLSLCTMPPNMTGTEPENCLQVPNPLFSVTIFYRLASSRRFLAHALSQQAGGHQRADVSD